MKRASDWGGQRRRLGSAVARTEAQWRGLKSSGGDWSAVARAKAQWQEGGLRFKDGGHELLVARVPRCRQGRVRQRRSVALLHAL